MASVERLTHPAVVVIANDQEWASRSLESLLGPRGYAVLRVPSGRQALDLARTMNPDALILDVRTQDLGAIDVCRLLRADPHGRHTIPVIVTANDGSARSERLEALDAGAWEYCTQPIDGEVLLLKLATFVKAKREFDRVVDECLIDDTTGLYTLRGLVQRAREIGAQASRKHQPLSCIAFAPVRDEQSLDEAFSPATTIPLIEHVALVCRKHGRVSDIFGRTGALEFAVLAPATDGRGAARLLARLQSAAAEASPEPDIGQRRLRLLAGVASVADFSESNVDAMDMLLRATDELRRLRVPAVDTAH